MKTAAMWLPETEGQLYGASKPLLQGDPPEEEGVWPMHSRDKAIEMVVIYNAIMPNGGAKLWERATPESEWKEIDPYGREN